MADTPSPEVIPRVYAATPDTEVECSRGFFLTKNENGEYVPFFVKVREQDIVWDWTIDDKYAETLGGRLGSIDVKRPTSSLTGSTTPDSDFGESWGIQLNTDLSCKLSKKIYIFKANHNGTTYDRSSGFYPNTNLSILTARVELPVAISLNKKDVFSVNLVKNYALDDLDDVNSLTSASLNWRPIPDENGNSFSAVYIDLMAPNIGGFRDYDAVPNNETSLLPEIPNLAGAKLIKKYAIGFSLEGFVYDEKEKFASFKEYQKRI